MSERREGRTVWLGPDGHTMNHATVAASRQGMYTVPACLTFLDPDGPKPGETWDQLGFGRVVIEHPRLVNLAGEVCEWWVRDANTGRCRQASTSDLSPIKPTRTVTVELTEEEVAELRSPRFFGGRALSKLAAAVLEDES